MLRLVWVSVCVIIVLFVLELMIIVLVLVMDGLFVDKMMVNFVLGCVVLCFWVWVSNLCV